MSSTHLLPEKGPAMGGASESGVEAAPDFKRRPEGQALSSESLAVGSGGEQ